MWMEYGNILVKLYCWWFLSCNNNNNESQHSNHLQLFGGVNLSASKLTWDHFTDRGWMIRWHHLQWLILCTGFYQELLYISSPTRAISPISTFVKNAIDRYSLHFLEHHKGQSTWPQKLTQVLSKLIPKNRRRWPSMIRFWHKLKHDRLVLVSAEKNGVYTIGALSHIEG